MTLAEIKENNLRCVIKVDSKEEAVKLFKIFNPDGYDANYAYDYLMVNYWKGDGTVCFGVTGNKIDGFDTETYYKKNEEQYGKTYRFKDLIAIGDFCDGFRGGKIPTTKKEEKKMPTKFTFYTTDWTDIDKSNGKKIPMKTTYAYIGSYQDERADTSCPVSEYDERIGCLIAAAKISAKKSNEAQMMYNIARNTWGTELSWAILFELANTALNGNFERTYKKFHNDSIRFEKKRLTCSFCGKVFDTVEEKKAEEAWHVERKKARRERYLLRKRAKEIAFEEQAQKMAKEIIAEGNKK